MTEKPFSNRELTSMFQNIEEKLDSHAETHAKILEQVMFTNGKVRKLYVYVTIAGTAAGTAILVGGGEELIGFLLQIL